MRLASRCPFKSGLLSFGLGNLIGCQALADLFSLPGGASQNGFIVKNVMMRFNASVAPFFLEE